MLDQNLDLTSVSSWVSDSCELRLCLPFLCWETAQSQPACPQGQMSTKGGWGLPTRLTGLDSLNWDQFKSTAVDLTGQIHLGKTAYCYHCINVVKYLAPLFFCSLLFRTGCKYALCWNQSAKFLAAWSYSSQGWQILMVAGPEHLG